MEVTRRQMAVAFLVVAAACGLAGAGLAWLTVRWGQRSPATASDPRDMPATSSVASGSPQTRPTQTRPAQTHPAALMAAAEEATVIGRAVCSSCGLGIGPADEHHLYLATEDPYRIFEVLTNEQREELLAVTGECAAGDYEVTASGRVGVMHDRNTLLISRFSARPVSSGRPAPP